MGIVVEEALPPELEEFSDEQKAKMLPDPKGWNILCAAPKFDVRFDNSIIERPDKTVEQEAAATVVLFVVKLGPDAYMDKTRYPSGPWCKEGDFVMVRQYSGTRFRIFGKEFRFILEDQVQAVVEDPRGISRA